MTRERIELPTVGWFNIHFHHSLSDDFGLESNALPAELTSLNPNLRRKYDTYSVVCCAIFPRTREGTNPWIYHHFHAHIWISLTYTHIEYVSFSFSSGIADALSSTARIRARVRDGTFALLLFELKQRRWWRFGFFFSSFSENKICGRERMREIFIYREERRASKSDDVVIINF